MQEFSERVAVITGAAGGIGLALARQALARGMRLVLSDLDAAALEGAGRALGADAARLLLHPADVSRDAEVAALAQAAFARFGAVHLLCNNAGVGFSRLAAEHSAADWEWVIGVNLFGVAHGIRHFLPRMQAAGQPAHVLNTASAAGLVSTPGLAAYNASKQGVVALSETLRAELAAQRSPIGVSVLCPAWVPTAIHASSRVRPGRFGAAEPASAASAPYEQNMEHAVLAGRLSADDVARIAFEAMARGQFYIVPHARIGQAVQERFAEIAAAAAFTPPSPATPPSCKP
ncbi:SDR family NAD(P)-dependent oxidoreductase [Thiomonas sp. FB-6]|uniref:SDR family NAD(P)-dependent oxidoreductase n=1 Tax=Thiomonas sp. FB-6 TaxID=1158291 RepID=UPI00036150C6|nr:SDR family NAD(P)-dependent oxidoreductase [Thiomonas sp. FB-6]